MAGSVSRIDVQAVPPKPRQRRHFVTLSVQMRNKMSQNKANISFKGNIRLVQTSLLGTNVFFCHVSTSCPEIVTQSVAAKQFFGFSQLLGSMRKNSVFFTIAFCYTMCTEIGTEFERLYMPGIFPTGTVDINLSCFYPAEHPAQHKFGNIAYVQTHLPDANLLQDPLYPPPPICASPRTGILENYRQPEGLLSYTYAFRPIPPCSTTDAFNILTRSPTSSASGTIFHVC